MNVLFVCSRNQWRSPTVVAIYKHHSDINVKSAGTEPSARNKLNAKLILWANLIFVMERKHKQRISERFPNEVLGKQIVILEIADEYKFMDSELIEEIEMKVNQYL